MYLQHREELKNLSEIPKDSILRAYELQVTEYKIQPLDQLFIQFESLTSEEYDFFSRSSQQGRQQGNVNNNALRGITVDLEGNVEYPVVGKVSIAGLTVFEAQEKLQKLANEYIDNAVVRIRTLNFRFTVLGEVNGEKVVNSANTRVNMMEAIGLAGGFSELADRSNVKVVRQNGNTQEIFYINLLEEDYIHSPYYFIQQNDIVIVPALKQRTFKKYFASNLGVLTSSVSAILFLITILTR